MTRFKICCIRSIEEMQMAVSAGASAIGLVSAMPSGPGPIEEPLIRQIAAATPPGVESVLLTSLQDARGIIEQNRRCGCSCIQLVDELTGGSHRQIRQALPGVRLIQVIHVEGPQAVDQARAYQPHVDALLLDSGSPGAELKTLGGTGNIHDWSISRTIVDSVDLPVWLAGGLSPANVAEAVAQVQPFGVDICSRLRPNEDLDPQLLQSFTAQLR